MGVLLSLSLFLFLFLTLLLSSISGQDEVYSCGGFIVSSVPINFASIKVKLFSRDGHLKYDTECAPNNGYYMIPVYAKGAYKLEVDPPPGWEFEPKIADLLIDGETDACTLGKDINFKFKGFFVVGQVCNGENCKGKVQDVEVGLFRQISDSQSLLKSKTDKTGRYTFRGVSSGKYVVKLLSEDLCAKEGLVVHVVVSESAFSVSSDLMISGFSVEGSIVDKDKGVAGATINLYGEYASKILPKHCEKETVTEAAESTGASYICSILSDKNGRFRFPCLNPGQFSIRASYVVNDVRFDIKPQKIDFRVVDSILSLEEKFKIEGFSSTGKVAWSKNGKPIKGSKIIFDNRPVDITSDANGLYMVTKIEPGMHKLLVKSENAEFEPLSITLDLKNHTIPEISPSRLNLCGKIDVDADNKKILKQRKLLLTNLNKKSEIISITTDQQGLFCKMVDIGKYILEPQILNEEKKMGFSLVPESLSVDLTDAPKLDVKFQQFKAKISGVIKCLDKCINLKVNLFKDALSSNPLKTVVVDKESKFSFDGLSNANFLVEVEADIYCWKAKTLPVTVNNADVQNLVFEQIGFLLIIGSSHDANVEYKLIKNEKISKQISLSKGPNHLCLPVAGLYKFLIDSCHNFENFPENAFDYDTNQRANKVWLQALKHKVEGLIVADEKINDLLITIRRSSKDGVDDSVVTLGPLIPYQKGDSDQKPVFIHSFEYFSTSNQALSMVPKSKSHLFNPSELEIDIQESCAPNLLFKAEKGKFLTINIHPILEGVAVTLTSKIDSALHFSNWTTSEGRCSLGPLRTFNDLMVQAVKSGYLLTEVEGKLGHFNAYKLSELTLKAIDAHENILAGVLLSLSGKSYRSNNLTGDNGSITFVGLSPGEYFVKPILKEYSFDPPTQIVKIEEGSTISVDLIGKRVAYSCLGMVRHLAGQPVSNVEVEAFPQKDCSHPQAAHEEATTSEDGIYKIRGLLPTCRYILQLKPSQNNVPKTIPSRYTIEVVNEDLADKDLILRPEFTTMEIAGRVLGDRTLFQHLKVVLYREDNVDTPISAIPLQASSLFFFPALPLDNKVYVVKLENSLPGSKYAKAEHTEVTIKANKTFHFVNLSFSFKKKVDESESIKGGFIVLPFTILFILLIYNYEKILPTVSAIHSVMLSKSTHQSLQSKNKFRGSNTPTDSDTAGVEGTDFDDEHLPTHSLHRRKSKPRKA